MNNLDVSEATARGLDSEDPLTSFRERFYIPQNTIYLDGNSLGLLSVDAEKALQRAVDDWKMLGIRGWLEAEHRSAANVLSFSRSSLT